MQRPGAKGKWASAKSYEARPGLCRQGVNMKANPAQRLLSRQSLVNRARRWLAHWVGCFACAWACLAAGTNSVVTDGGQSRQVADGFIGALSRGDPSAFGLIRPHWYDADEGARLGEDFERQWRALEAVLRMKTGQRVDGGWEYLGTKRLGTCLIKFVYILKYEYGVCPWVLTFYRPDDEWRLGGIALGDPAVQDMTDLEAMTDAVPDELRKVVVRCMEAMARGNISVAFSDLEDLWGKPEEAAQVFLRLERQLRSGAPLQELHLGKRVGPGFELIGGTAVGRSLIQIVCVERRELGFFPWVFRFYRAQDTWHLVAFAVGTDVSASSLTGVSVIERAP